MFLQQNNFWDFLFFFPGQRNPSEKGSTLKGKNLLVYIEKEAKKKIVELNSYKFTVIK